MKALLKKLVRFLPADTQAALRRRHYRKVVQEFDPQSWEYYAVAYDVVTRGEHLMQIEVEKGSATSVLGKVAVESDLLGWTERLALQVLGEELGLFQKLSLEMEGIDLVPQQEAAGNDQQESEQASEPKAASPLRSLAIGHRSVPRTLLVKKHTGRLGKKFSVVRLKKFSVVSYQFSVQEAG